MNDALDKNIILIGVAGGSGSGKTTFARMIQNSLGCHHCDILGQDSYYIDQSYKFDQDGGAVNFDHPSALDFDLLARHLKDIKAGGEIHVPRYDFATHRRLRDFDVFGPKRLVILDGTLIFSQDHVHVHLDEKVYISAGESVRYQRRLKRDTLERGRTPEGVKSQFFRQVKPMHDQYVAPSKRHASFHVGVDDFDEKLDQFCHYIKNKYQL